MQARSVTLSARLLVAALGAAVLAALWHVPNWLTWAETEITTWIAGLQLAGPALASTLCTVAALRSAGNERRAWAFISAGSMLYIVGNLAYLAGAHSEAVSVFPSWADIPFFLMAVSFWVGIYLYG